MMIVDHVIVQCLGCKGERTVWPDEHIRGAQAIIDWVNAMPIVPCRCGAARCNLRMHLIEPPNDTISPDDTTQEVKA